jgi:Cytochrome P460
MSIVRRYKIMRKACLLLLAVCWSSFFALADSSDGRVSFPEGYRKWTFLHATVFGAKNAIFGTRPCEKPCTGGIMYFYANEKAMEGLRTGTFADGAIIADELLETHGSEDGNTAKEGPRRGVGVMVKDRQRYAKTGGWGFASFDGDSRTDTLSAEGKNTCFQCHVPRKDRDYVFTVYRER